MNELQVFTNPEFGQVRTVEVNGGPWFVGKDVAQALGYSDTFGALKKHVDEEDKQNCQNDSFETPRGMTIINESGLYSLVLSSKLPGAKKFKRWITSKVLPAIRKTGSYTARPDPMKNALAEAKLNNSRARVASTWLRVGGMVSVPEYKDVCAHYASTALAGYEVLPLPEVGEHLYTAAQVGEMLGISANAVGRLANKNGLKTPEYGKMVWDKSPNSPKQVEAFRYNQRAVDRIKALSSG